MTRNPCFTVVLVVLSVASAVHVARAADWPQWRGPNRDAKSLDTGLVKEWSEGGPPVAWQLDTVGEGYSSLAVAEGRVITQGDLDGVEHVIALSEKDGTLLWAVQPEPVAAELATRVDEQFTKFDENGDGQLDEIEALAGLGWNYNQSDRAVEGDHEEIAQARTESLFKSLDENRDGRLQYDEAPGAMQNEFARIDSEDKSADGLKLAMKRADELVTAADEDLDFKVSKKEANGTLLTRLFGAIDGKDPVTNKGDEQLTADEIRTYFFAREPGRDGELTAEELANYYARSFPGKDGILQKADILRHIGGFRNGTGNGPRGTPTIDGKRVYAEGGSGDLTCLDVETGKTIWHVNLQKDLGGGRPGWGYCESPLVVGNEVIVTPGGKEGTIAALDKNTGEVLWRSTEVQEPAHYSSPQMVTIAGVPQIVQFARNSVFGVSTSGDALLWNYSGANNGTANIATPIVSDDYVLASSAYGTGTGLVKVSAGSGKQQEAKEVYFQNKVANHHGGLVKVGDHVYSFSGGLVCMDFATGEIVWKARSVGKGSLVYADGMLYCLGERYEVELVEATPEEYRSCGKFTIEGYGRPSWAHPVVAGGRFYIRNQQRLTAYDVKAP